MRVRLGTVVAFSTLIAASSAHAGGFYSGLMGGELGHPTTDDLTAIYFNPAGLSLGSGTRLQLNGLIGYRWARYTRPEGAIDDVVPAGSMGTGTPADAIGANSGHATATNLQVLPFAGLVSDLGVKNLAVAVGFFVPFGGMLSWDKNAAYAGSSRYPGAVDGPARWAMIDGDLRSYYFSAAVSYTIEKAHLSIGAAGNVIYNTLSTLRARDANGSDDLVSSTGEILEGRTQLDAANLTGSIALGAIWQAAPGWFVGLSYQSQPGFGEMTMKGTLKNKFGTGMANSQAIELEQSYPDILGWGIRGRLSRLVELRVSGDWQRWSVFNRQCILDASNPMRSCALTESGAIDTRAGGAGIILNLPRNWNDTFALHLSSTWFLSSSVELMVGVAYDSNAVPNSTMDAGLFDQDKLYGAVGARVWLLRHRLMIVPTWTQVVYIPRTVDVQPRYASGQRIAPAPPSLSPDGAGRYLQSVGMFSLAVEYRFR